jgi:hypothetical protein
MVGWTSSSLRGNIVGARRGSSSQVIGSGGLGFICEQNEKNVRQVSAQDVHETES